MPVIDMRVKNGNPGMIVACLPMCTFHEWRKTLIMPRRTETGGKPVWRITIPGKLLRDRLIAPRKLVPQASAPHNGSGWRSAISRGGMGAKAETIRFLKERSLPGRKVLAVTFENQAGRMMNFTHYLVQNEQGAWEVRGGSGGGEEGSRLVREQPWVNLGGGGWPNDFYAGGQVIDNGSGVARVRLVAANGTILEDSVEDGAVLFLSEQPVDIPLQAELYDHHGKRVANHTVFDL